MNKKEKFSFLKGKGASVGIVLCFVAVIAMVGTVTFRNYKKNMNEQIAKVQQAFMNACTRSGIVPK